MLNNSLMCPMTLFVSAVLFHRVTTELVANWMQNIVINILFALFTQLFFVQPVVRFIFRIIFINKLNREEYKLKEVM